MRSLICSNFNILKSNSIWKKLQNFDNFYFDEYNNFSFSLQKNNDIKNYSKIFLLLYINDYMGGKKINELTKFLNHVAKENPNKSLFVFFFLRKTNNYKIDKNNELLFYKSMSYINIDSNNINIFNLNNKHIKYDLRNYYYIRCPIKIESFYEIIDLMNSINSEKTNKPFKMIILDCDNTLWGGVVGEDGIDSIEYGEDGNGKIFEEVQKHLKYLKNNGVLLSIASKNNEDIVWKTLKKRKMILQKRDFILPKINWDEKFQNINNTTNSLNLRQEDILFIDDNFIEIAKVKKQLKNINTYKIDDLSEYIKFLYENERLQNKNLTTEDKKKYAQYKIREKFEKLKAKKQDFDLYKSLNQKINIIKINEKNINRAEQLFNKVNQFNFTTNRFKISDIYKFNNDKNSNIKLISFSDKFGDHGIVGLYKTLVKNNNLYITDFLMSCRVINRKIEEKIILNIFKESKNKNIFIIFIKNENNKTLIGSFLKKSFFRYDHSKKTKKYFKVNLNSELKNVEKFFK